VIIEGDISPQGGSLDPIAFDCPFCGAPRTRPCVMVTKFGIRVAKGPHSARIKRAKQEAMR